jgi:hypothetical protein
MERVVYIALGSVSKTLLREILAARGDLARSATTPAQPGACSGEVSVAFEYLESRPKQICGG